MRTDDQVGAIVDRDPWDIRVGARDQARDVRLIGVEALTAAGPHLDSVLGDQRRGDLILRRQRIGRAERHLGAGQPERSHQVRRLGGHMQAGGDPDSAQRTLALKPLGHLGKDGHLARRPGDPVGAGRRQREVGDLVRRER